MKKKLKQITAVDIKRATTVALPTGGSNDVQKGAVLLVPNEISQDDSRYLCAMGKAEPCDPKLKAERAKAALESEGKKDDK